MGEVIKSDRYTTAQVVEALVAVANAAGNCAEAARQVGIPKRTVVDWVTRYPQRYREAAEAAADAVARQVAKDYREFAAATPPIEKLALQRIRERLERDEDKMPAQTLQRVLISKAIATDKDLVTRQKPTAITASVQSVEEDLRFLRSKALRIPEAQVVEEKTEAEVVQSPPELPPAA
jgi:bacterioferritin-associated ferredoxin